MMKSEQNILVLTHLSQLLFLFTVCGSVLVPLLLWATQRDKIIDMDEQGKSILNFQISLFIWALACIPLILFFGLGILGLLGLLAIATIYPIINAIRVSHNKLPSYPLSFNFIS